MLFMFEIGFVHGCGSVGI